MPLPLALLLMAAADDPSLLLKIAGDRLGTHCTDAVCGSPASPFRLDRDVEGGASMKDRAIGNDGTYCNVVGARRCTSHGRTILRAALGE